MDAMALVQKRLSHDDSFCNFMDRITIDIARVRSDLIEAIGLSNNGRKRLM